MSPSTPEKLIRPPVLRTTESEARKATWTELFFDLVFVVAVSSANNLLAKDHSARGMLWFAGMIVLVVWTWQNYVLYTQRFDTDDVIHRLIKTCAMVAIAWAALVMPGAGEGGRAMFAMAYVAVRLPLIMLYSRAWRHVHEVRSGIRVYLVGFSLGATVWALSALAPVGARVWLWVLGASIELGTPLVGWRALGEAAMSEEHLDERLGQFMLIVLGEAVLGIVAAIRAAEWGMPVGMTAAGAAVIVLVLWWLTFDYVEAGAPKGTRGLEHIYSHIPVYAAIAGFGVGAELALEEASHHALTGTARWVICLALMIYLFGIMLVRMTSRDLLPMKVIVVHPVLALVVGAIGIISASWTPSLLVGAVAIVLTADLLFKLFHPEVISTSR